MVVATIARTSATVGQGGGGGGGGMSNLQGFQAHHPLTYMGRGTRWLGQPWPLEEE